MSDSFWSQPCPARNGLPHKHWNECNPSGVHPHDASGNEGNQHPYNMCCDCQKTEAMIKAEQPAPPPPVEEHEFLWTVFGRCRVPGCGKTEAEHIQIEEGETPPGVCDVKHDSINQSGLSIDDDGLTWKRCPKCQVLIEPKMATGEPQGKKDGIGRGWVSPRMRMRWVTLANKHKLFNIQP